MIAPLYFRDFPTTGPAGARDNIERLRTVMSALMPHGWTIVLAVQHEDGCPAGAGHWNEERCICRTVDVEIRPHDPRLS